MTPDQHMNAAQDIAGRADRTTERGLSDEILLGILHVFLGLAAEVIESEKAMNAASR